MQAWCDDDGSVLSAGALAESVRLALARPSRDEALRAVIDIAMDTAPCDHASITVPGPRRTVHTVAWSDERIGHADRLQSDLNEGPGLDTVRADATPCADDLLLAENLRADRRWPRWAPAAVQLGLHAVIAVRLFTDTSWGALNLYSDDPRDYDDLDLQAARVVAAHASAVLAYTNTTDNLRRAMATRNLIGQAQGILMARYDLTPDQAFALLRTHSQNRNVRLVTLAEQVTRTGQLPNTDQNNRRTQPGTGTVAGEPRPPPARPTRTRPSARAGSRVTGTQHHHLPVADAAGPQGRRRRQRSVGSPDNGERHRAGAAGRCGGFGPLEASCAGTSGR
jgi:hypothetical protein